MIENKSKKYKANPSKINQIKKKNWVQINATCFP